MTQPRIPQNSLPRFRTIFLKPAITLKSSYSKHPPKWPNQEFHKTASQDFGPSFANFLRIYNPQHNGVHVTTLLFINKSIKVRSAKWGGRTLKNEWCNVFSKVFWIFEKRTFINVHFLIFISRFEKNVNFSI